MDTKLLGWIWGYDWTAKSRGMPKKWIPVCFRCWKRLGDKEYEYLGGLCENCSAIFQSRNPMLAELKKGER